MWQITASSQCSTHHVEYWSPYAKESRPNLTPFGRYKYLRPPSGINLAPEEFESKLHNKLDGLPGVEVISDDTLVMGYGKNEEKANQNHKNLLRLLDRSRKGNIRLNSSKMNLRKSEVRFLGHLITMNRLKPNPDKVKAVEMPKPQIRNCQVSWDSSITCQSSCLVIRSCATTEGLDCKVSKIYLVRTARGSIQGSKKTCSQTPCAEVLWSGGRRYRATRCKWIWVRSNVVAKLPAGRVCFKIPVTERQYVQIEKNI